MDINEIELHKIDVDELVRHLEARDVSVLDVRVHPSEEQIPGAIRVDPAEIDDCDDPQIGIPKDRLIVTYCT